MLKRFIDNENGSTFMLVMVGFFVLFVFTATIIFIGNANSRHVVKEENRTKAYYVAKTGAESYINYLKEEIKDGNNILTYLDDLDGKTSKKSTFEDGTFEIKIEKFTEKDTSGVDVDKYRVITTGTVKGEESTLTAIVSPQFHGGGYKTGDGKIFVNKTGQIQIPTVPQLTGAGVSIYSLDKKYGDKVPIHINAPGDINEIFSSLNDRGKSTVKDLNAQEKNKYRLEITDPKELDSKVSSSNPIKVENLVKYKGSSKDPNFEEIEFIYDTNKKDVLYYFSKGKLFESSMTDSEIKEGLESTFLIPIRSVADYRAYIDGTTIYPSSPQYSETSFSKIVDDLTSSKELSTKREINIPRKGNVLFKDGINLNNGGDLTINTDGDTDIKVEGNIRMGDSNKKEKITINANGNVNFYITGDVQLSGNIKVVGDAEVNFYMYGSSFQINNGSKVENINLYAPNTDVQLQNNIEYQGIIVTKEFEMNDNSTFKAPSSGPASTGTQQSSKIEIDWVR